MQERWLGLALRVGLVGLVGLLISSVAAACGGTNMPSAVISHTLVGCFPTPTAAQNAGLSRPIVNGVTFGGPMCAFATRYGDTHLTDYQWQGLELFTTFDEAVDGEPHVSQFDIYPLDKSVHWTMPQAGHVCLPFLPPDAIHRHDSQDTWGDVTQVYTSAQLAATFPTSSSAYDPTGTIVLSYTVDADGVFDCAFTTHP